jgi:hypothetical protein
MTEKKVLIFFGGNNPKPKKLGLPDWIPTNKLPFTQSINRINKEIGDQLNPFKSIIMTETIDELKNFPKDNNSFEELVHNRAIEIQEKTKGSNVYLMYSGGIDSTTAIVSIMNTWNEENLERLYILMSYRSIEEFPDMWKTINKKFKGRIINSLTNTNFIDKGYIITGEHGDQVFGSDVIIPIVDYYGNAGINLPWKNNINSFYKVFFNKSFSKNVDMFVDKYAMTLQHCPFEIKTCFDFVWWFNFTNKWQLVKYRLLNQRRFINPEKSIKKVIHFFDTPYIQKWSLENHDKKIKDTLITYKYTAKEFIVKYTGFEEYLNKPKIGSLQHVGSNFDRVFAFDQNYEEMTFNETLGCVNNYGRS